MKATTLVLVCLALTSSAQDSWKGALDRAKDLRQTDPSGARREFQEAERLASQVGGEALVRVWIDLAAFLMQQRNYRDAETVLRNALTVQDQTPGISAAWRARVLNSLALTQLELGRYDERLTCCARRLWRSRAPP
jgi:uncharacterized protein HemY